MYWIDWIENTAVLYYIAITSYCQPPTLLRHFGNIRQMTDTQNVQNIYWILIQICNIYTIFFTYISTSISSIQLCECSHSESELSCMLCKWTHCTVHLENIEMKDVKVTVVLRLQHLSKQLILQCFLQLVYP